MARAPGRPGLGGAPARFELTQWANPQRWQAERPAAFPGTKVFWRRQGALADAAWDIASRPFPWPPRSPADSIALIAALRPRPLLAAPFAFRSMASLAPSAQPLFRAFLDAQLLISAQITAGFANALYGSAALDLPRRGDSIFPGQSTAGVTLGAMRVAAEMGRRLGQPTLYKALET